MASYSTNQNRQMYVVNGENAVKNAIAALTTVGNIYAQKNADGDCYIVQKGNGGLVRSDLINVNSVMWATASAPEDTQITLKSVKVSIKQDALCAGQDYVLRIVFKQAFGMSDEDMYIKDAAVHTYIGMDEAQFYTEMAASLLRNFHRLYSPLIEISDGTNVAASIGKENGVTVVKNAAGQVLTFTDGIYINEMSQEGQWALGTAPYTPVYFEVIPTTIIKDGEEIIWGEVEDNTEAYDTHVGNGYKTADLEYFCMGERGDQYRNIFWPKSIPTKYFTDPSKTYYYLDIHYAYQGSGEDVQKSEKTITIAAEKKATIDAIISKFEGITVKTTDNYTSAS